MSRRILVDTSVYISWIKTGRFEDVVDGRRGVPILSSVVAMELLAGSSALRRWVEKFATAKRLLVPSWTAWKRGGQVLRRLNRKGDGGEGLLADVLIAMSARESGLLVVTANGKHFERIAAIDRFPLEVVA